ncbi:MAG: hypothetical protein ACFFHV_14840 [Promethearchaeota archaeon]
MSQEDKSIQNIEFISTSGVFKTSFSLVILFQLYFGIIIVIVLNLWYINYLYYFFTGNLIYSVSIIEEDWFYWLLVLLLPLNIYGNIFLFTFSIIFFSAGIMKLLNWIHPPREGIFERGSKDWKYVHRRFWTAYLPIWLARVTPLPWIDIICYRVFGVKIGKNVVAYEGYIDPIFVEIGDFSMTSLNICIFSHLIYHDKVIIKKVKIGKACVVGPQTIISPGTVMKDRAVLGANSYTWIGQKLESDLIHVGTPVSVNFPIQTLEQSLEKAERIKKSDQSDNPGGQN